MVATLARERSHRRPRVFPAQAVLHRSEEWSRREVVLCIVHIAGALSFSVLFWHTLSCRHDCDHVAAGSAQGIRILVGVDEQLNEVGPDILPPAERLQQLARLNPARVIGKLCIDAGFWRGISKHECLAMYRDRESVRSEQSRWLSLFLGVAQYCPAKSGHLSLDPGPPYTSG